MLDYIVMQLRKGKREIKRYSDIILVMQLYPFVLNVLSSILKVLNRQ